MPDKLLTIVLSFGLTLMALFVITVGRDLLIPIAVSLLLWLLINSLANVLGSIKLGGESLPGWLSLSSSLLVIGTALVLVGELIAHNVPAIVEKAPQLQADLDGMWAKLSARLGQEKLHEFTGIVSGFKLSSILVASAQACAKIVENAGTILIYVMFMLMEQKTIGRKLTILFPDESRRKSVHDFLQVVQSKVQAYLSTTALMSLLGGGVTYVVLALIGVEFAAFWGLLTFLLSFIPTVGALASIVFPALLALVEFPTLWPFAVVVIGLGCAHMIIGNVIEPRFIGHSLNLSPLAVILSLSVWGAIWGMSGMFLCVPLTVILMIIFGQFQATKPIAVALSAEGEV
jgi:AI-2 transport protein TqsA